MLRSFLLALIVASSFLCTVSRAQVERFGGNDLLDRAEDFMGFGWTCEEATKAELSTVDECIDHYQVNDLKNAKDFDNLTEQLMFLEATRKTHQLSTCQVKLHDSFASDLEIQNSLLETAYTEFGRVRPLILKKISEKTLADANVASVRSTMNFHDDLKGGTLHASQERLLKAQERAQEAEAGLMGLVARVPIGNRPQMREQLLKLFVADKPISRDDFTKTFKASMNDLSRDAHRAQKFFDSLSTKPPGLYQIDEDLKKALVRSGQVENTIKASGLNDRLARGFSCRTQARYKSGPQSLMAAELPFYFLGAYGLGRLSARAGVALLRASSVSARAVSQVSLWSSRAAMLGLDGYQWARVASQIREACIPQEFLSGALDESCTAESEVQGVYQEAYSAQCLTSAAAGIAPLAAVATARLVTTFRAASPRLTLERKGVVKGNQETFFDRSKPLSLTDDERVHLFKEYSGIKNLKKLERQELLRLHKIGKGYGSYTKSELRQKSEGLKKILADHGIKDTAKVKKIVDTSLRQGVFGQSSVHDSITRTLYNGEVISITPFSENLNANALYVVKVKARDPSTGADIVEEAIFKPRFLGDSGGFNRTPMEYVAYHLNQKLGMDYVPPTAYRRGLHLNVNGVTLSEGALIHKVPDFKAIEDLVPTRAYPTSHEAITSDHRILNVLLHNSDGHSKNLGVGTHWQDGKTSPTFIDFGASFRPGTDVTMTHYPAYGNSQPVTRVRASTLKELKKLKREDFDGPVGDNLMTSGEVSELLSRRDGIVSYFERLRRENPSTILED
jgi:hypothetical protein